MLPLIVVDNPKNWPLDIPGASLISARAYLTYPHYFELRGARVFNLCRSYRYQTNGYYVSLLAMARGHKPMPGITAIQDMKSLTIVRMTSDDLDDLIQRSLRPLASRSFTLSVYFGRNIAKRYAELSAALFRLFQAPLLRAQFLHDEDGWRLSSLRPIAANDVPDAHRPFVIEAATRFFSQNRAPARRRSKAMFDLAILSSPADPTPPSDPAAIKRFIAAATRQRLEAEVIDKDEYGRLAEFDALFIRETTAVNHHTYRFARRAMAEGLVVIDDPDSILKCGNKVFLAELLDCHSIPTPRTLIVHRDNRELIHGQVGLPAVLKRPDSSFSQGVTKVDDPAELDAAVERLLEDSDLIIAQEFLPTPFDWRIGILDRKPLFACRYHMAAAHWQIVRRDADGRSKEGKVDAVPLGEVPAGVVSTALRAAKLIGDGLYGVDIKQIDKKIYVIEVNDNPNIDTGCEDRLLGNELYDRIMQVFVERITRRKNLNGSA